MSKSVRAQRSGAYLQEAVISIFVAGTMELSGSKSPIVAMAEAIFYLFSLNQLFSVPEVRTFITAQTFLWLCVCVPSNRECESAASGSSSCCRWSASGQEAYLRMRLSFTARESERERAKLTEPDAQASLRLCPLNSSPGGDRHPQIFQPYLGSTRNLVWKVICAKKKKKPKREPMQRKTFSRTL